MTGYPLLVEIRQGTPNDADAIAALHTRSWQTAYAEIMPADYLAGPLPGEHEALWRTRLGGSQGPVPGLLIIDHGDGLGGFAYLIPQPDGRILLDNLHVSPALKRSGIGSLLMRQCLTWAAGKPVYVEVLRDNTPARAFYQRLGGRLTREFVERFPLGFDLDVIEYTWSELS